VCICVCITLPGPGAGVFPPQLWISLMLVTQNAVCRSLQDRGFPWPIYTSAKSFYTTARLWTWKEDLEVAVTYCTADHDDGNGEYILCILYCGYMFVIVRQLLNKV